jgi:hypothetical protein
VFIDLQRKMTPAEKIEAVFQSNELFRNFPGISMLMLKLCVKLFAEDARST